MLQIIDCFPGFTEKYNDFKKKKEFTYWLTVTGMDNIDTNTLLTNFGAVKKKQSGEITFPTQKPLDVNDKKTENIIKAFEYLRNTGKYDVPNIDETLDELGSVKNDKLTADDIIKIKDSTDNKWIEFMQNIQKPEVQLLLQSIGQYHLANDTFGWQYAADNIVRAYAQNPNATFLQTRNQWRKKFNRRIVNGAKPIGLVVPMDGSYVSNDDRRKQMSKTGYKSNTKYSDLSRQQKDHIDISIRSLNQYDNKKFKYFAFYDISDTVLISGREDIFANEVGFKNNLTGDLNDKAIELKAKEGSIDTDVAKELYNNRQGDVVDLYKKLSDGIKKNYMSLGVINPKSDDINDIGYAYQASIERLADYLIENEGKYVRAENRRLSVAIATTIVLCLTRVKPENVAEKLKNNELTMDSYFELRNVINKIIKTMNNNIKESINNDEIPQLSSVDELLNMLGMTREDVPTLTQKGVELKENFHEVLNKINKSSYCDEKID